MNLFSSDADLLGYEPSVFVDLPLGAQRRLRLDDAVVSEATVTSATGGLSVLAAGDVVVLGDGPGQWTAYAVEQVVNDNTIELRTAPIGFDPTEPVAMEWRTFRPQAELVDEELLRALGIGAEAEAAGLGAESILSTAVMRRLEALGTLSRAYAAGVGVSGEQGQIEAKAARYRRAFSRSLRGARVLIDTDGDGRADVWRMPGVVALTRG